MRQIASYSDIIETIQPLDLLAFRGADFVSNFISNVEETFVGSGEFTHVGIVVNKEILPSIEQLEDGKYYVWESTMSSEYPGSGEMAPDIISGKGRLGVQIRDLKDVVNSYTAVPDAYLAVCPLKNNPWLSSDKREIIKTIKYIHDKYGRRTYELGCCQLFGSVFSICRPLRDNFQRITVKDQQVIINFNINDEENNTWLFCSELVALIYKKVGILSEDVDIRDVNPMDLLGYDTDTHMDIVKEPIFIVP